VAFAKVRGFRPERTVSIGDDAGDDELGSPPIDWRPNPEQLYSRLELRNILRKVLESLPLGYSTVFWLRIEGFSIRETAEILGISEPAVKTRLLRARLQLRDRLSRYFGQEKTATDKIAAADSPPAILMLTRKNQNAAKITTIQPKAKRIAQPLKYSG
jgi:RNA polymerase sigma-70 factor (ECF subfamily)